MHKLRTWLADVWSRYRSLILAGVTALLMGGAVVIVGDFQGPDGSHTSVTVTVRGVVNQPVEVTAPKTAIAQAGSLGDHDDSRSEQPPGVTPQELDAGRAQQEALAASDQLPAVTPLAAPLQPGCVSRFVQNYSSRRGVRPRLFVLHYTVSPNRAGWSDVNSIVSLFDRPSFHASSNYVIDAEGNCAYIVRESDKAWTQAGFNSVSISVEQINTGSEATYAGVPGMSKLARVVSDATRRWEIPLRQGRVSGCTVTRSGVIDHAALGDCGGNHGDIAPYSTAQVIAAAQAVRARTAGVTHTDRVTCRKLKWWRNNGRPHGLPEQRAIRRRKALESRGVSCFRRGAVRTGVAPG